MMREELHSPRDRHRVDLYSLAVSWPAEEISVNENLVRSLLVQQHPDLAELPIETFGAGWDNTLWRLGESLIVRLPRRAAAAPSMANEQRWLPELAPRLSLPIPAPIRAGRPNKDFPWYWSVVPRLDGLPGDDTIVTRPDHAAEALGRFLRELHQPAPFDAPENPFRGVPLAMRADTFDERMAALANEIDATAARQVWDRAVAARPWHGPPVWLHGDLHPANILISDGTLAAVIDFGDLCAGDPATDLAAAWMLLPPSTIPLFSAAYGGVESDLIRRSLGWTVLFASMLLVIGLDDRPSYETVGRSTLTKAIEASDLSI
jgi:aminoglycoside phosphotransferase (APT) family kinase protein